MTPFAHLEKLASVVSNPSMTTAVLRSLKRLLRPASTSRLQDQLKGMKFDIQPSSKDPRNAMEKLIEAGARIEKSPVEIEKWLQTQRGLGGVLGTSADRIISKMKDGV